MLDSGDELGSCGDLAILVTHAQQAFEIINRARRCTYYGLECEEQAIMAKCGMQCRTGGRVVTPLPLLRVSLSPVHVLGAPQFAAFSKKSLTHRVGLSAAKSPIHLSAGRRRAR